MLKALSLCLALIAPVAAAEEIVLGLGQEQVDINVTFEGAEIGIVGAIRREAPQIGGVQGIIITVSGPQVPLTVRRKDRRFGIWINADSADVEAAPSFYSVATSAPLDDILLDGEDLAHSITVPRVIRSMETTGGETGEFTEALIRIQAGDDLYQLREGEVRFQQGTLFDTTINLPANLIEGDYSTRIFLTRDGQVAQIYETTIEVQKVGLERWLFNLAREWPAVYGTLSLALAILAGWLASAAFSVFRP